MEKKCVLLKKRKFTILVVIMMVCTMLISSVAGSISISSPVSGNHAIRKNDSGLSGRFQHHRIIDYMNNRESEKNLLNGLFDVVIHTKCGDVEKSRTGLD